MKSKKIIGIGVFIIGGLLLVNNFYNVQSNIDYFVNQKISHKIILVEDYYGKSLNFFYEKDHCITSFDTQKDTLVIGDSIFKNEKDSIFKVFRKNKVGIYEFFKAYKVNKSM